MPSGICDTGKTILDFADTRRSCRLSPAQIGLGNVESTAIGFIQNGAQVQGFLPTLVGRDSCKHVARKSVCPPC